MLSATMVALWTATTGLSVLAQTSARDIYQRSCATCHGDDGSGAMPGVPDLTSPNGPMTKSDAVLERSIEDGLQTLASPIPMPPRGGDPALTREQIRDLIRFLRSEFRK